MENYQMNRPCSRPYHTTCGMTRPHMNMNERMNTRNAERNEYVREERCGCHMPGTASCNAEMYRHVDQMMPAMAYVPCQKFDTTFDLCYALSVGTVFPELCKPFCGKRGVRR